MTQLNDLAALDGLKPELLWRFFGEICSIPHGSSHEYALGRHICRRAAQAGFAFKKDSAGNICLSIPASSGYEKSPGVVLQGHLDMVCEKESGSPFDFAARGIQPVRESNWIKGNGTSLGADNGIGVAAALAAAFSNEVIHGPLEILLTMEEETGLKGAMKLDPALISGRILFNLDSEKTGSVCIGCAGGCRMAIRIPLHFTDTFSGHAAVSLRIEGLQGGHSGLNINEGRGNAVKLLAQILGSVHTMQTTLVDFCGGDKPNAIPRSAQATICLPAKEVPGFKASVQSYFDTLAAGLPNEPSLALSMHEIPAPPESIPPVICKRILNLLLGLPSGVLAMSRDIAGVVQTSCNLAAVRILGAYLEVELMPRSATGPGIEAVAAQIAAIAELAGGDCLSEIPYPGWQPNLESPLLKVVDEVHQGLFGCIPSREATHAGIECGIIGKKIPGMDMISFGADISDCHSPSEKVFIPGVEKLWRLLCGLLETIAKKTG